MLLPLAISLSTLFIYALAETCVVKPLGKGRDDTDQVEAAIQRCGQFGTVKFIPNGATTSFNITRKMLWNLKQSKVELNADLNFNPDIQYWLNEASTFRVVFIQSQASWFVLTGSDFEVDAQNTGGIQGNGQPWWEYFTTVPREDGDGRPIALTIWNATRGVIKNFKINAPPFWCNAVSESQDITYDGMTCNATNTNPAFFGTNIVPNTDGIDTYRSDGVQMLHWDVTSGDDCLAIKGNSTNVIARNITCRGGNGIAFGSLGQYVNLTDIVQNVQLEDILVTRINSSIQPNMNSGVYFKSWDGSINGAPPTGGGAGAGHASQIVAKNVILDNVDLPLHLYQTNDGQSGDLESLFKFGQLSFVNWSGTSSSNTVVEIECSGAAGGCGEISFSGFNVTPPVGHAPSYICQNVTQVVGLDAPCNATGHS